MKLLSLSLACVAIALTFGTADASISLSNSLGDSKVEAQITSFVETVFTGTTIPTHTTVDKTDGAATSNNNVDWYVSGDQTILSLDMNHSRPGTGSSLAQTLLFLNFTAIDNGTYELSGYYDVTDVGDPGRTTLYGQFYDITASESLFWNESESLLSNASHELGVSGFMFGSLTGNVIAGHEYQFYGFATIHAYPDDNSGASAVGNITLKIGTADANGALPEPFSLMVWVGLACAATTATHRRFSRR